MIQKFQLPQLNILELFSIKQNKNFKLSHFLKHKEIIEDSFIVERKKLSTTTKNIVILFFDAKEYCDPYHACLSSMHQFLFFVILI